MFIEVHVLCWGLYSVGPCSLRSMFCVQVSTLEVHVHWCPCSVFRSSLWRSMFIEVHVLCSGLYSGGPCSLRYMFCVQVSTLEVHVHWGTCSVFRSLLWRSMFIEVHVLCSGLHSGGPCSLRYMFCVQVSTLEVHVHWGTCSVFRSLLCRSMFSEVHTHWGPCFAHSIGLNFGGPHSLSYKWQELFNRTDWWTIDLPRYWCPIHHHRNLLPNGFNYLSLSFEVEFLERVLSFAYLQPQLIFCKFCAELIVNCFGHVKWKKCLKFWECAMFISNGVSIWADHFPY